MKNLSKTGKNVCESVKPTSIEKPNPPSLFSGLTIPEAHQPSPIMGLLFGGDLNCSGLV